MTDVTTSPTAHLSEQDVEALGDEFDAIRDDVLADLGEHDARYIRRVIAAQRGLEAGGRGALLVSLLPARVARRHGDAVGGQDPGEHGDRPQRPARPVGLDARPRDPFGQLGVGLRVDLGVLEARAQLRASHVHERARQGPRPGLLDPAHRARPAVAPGLPRPAGLHRADGAVLRVGDRDLRHRARERPCRQEAVAAGQGRARRALAQGPQAAAQGLRHLSAALGSLGDPGVARQPDRERRAQRLGAHDHRLRALPRRRGDVQRGAARRRDARWLVHPPAARLVQPRRPAAPAPDERQPLLPDRAPPLPRPPEQPLRRDRSAGPRDLRALRAPVHQRLAAAPVRAGHQAGAAPGASGRWRRRARRR